MKTIIAEKPSVAREIARIVGATRQEPSYLSGNGYAVTLRALESGEEIFSMTLTAATKAQAKRFCERWPKLAPKLYQQIMGELGELPAEEPPQGEADQP